MDAFLEKVLATIRRHGMFSDCSRAVVGVSGGPDSLALLHALAELRRGPLSGVALYAAHLHHGMRGAEADGDARATASACDGLGVPCIVERSDVRRLARERGLGEEEAGRLARYEFLAKVARDVGASRIATGHHADDQVETILMRVRRGAGPRGLGGIPYVRAADRDGRLLIVRPLLDCTRAEIVAFLTARCIAWRLDRMNLSLDHLRNRIRYRILPFLERQWSKDLRQDLLRFGAACRRLHGQGMRLARAASGFPGLLVEAGYVEAPLRWLHAVPEAALAEILQYWMASAGLAMGGLTARHYARVALVVRGELRATTLPGGLVVGRQRDRLLVYRPWDSACEGFAAPLHLDGATPVPPLGCEVAARVLDGSLGSLWPRIESKSTTEDYLDLDRLPEPLVLRFPRAGDRMRLLGAPGTRKVHDILADRAVPAPRRRRTLILVAGPEVVWLCGYGPAECAKLTNDTRRVLWLRRRGAS